MRDIDVNEITSLISSSRLKSYETLIDGKIEPEQLIGLYNWNKAISSALYPIFQCLEVSLRNAIHTEASKEFSGSDWFDRIVKKASDEKFLDEIKKDPALAGKYYRSGVVGYSKRSKGKGRWSSHLESQLRGAKKRLVNSQKTITADGIVADTMFGFWTGLFEAKFRDVTSSDTLWPQLEKRVFPYTEPALRESTVLYKKLDEIREVRNRLSHHEPIWKNKSVSNSVEAIEYLTGIVTTAIDIIGYMSLDREKLLVRTGVVGRLIGLLDLNVMKRFQHHKNNINVDKCHLRRELNKLITRSNLPEETLTIRHFGKAVVTVTPVNHQ